MLHGILTRNVMQTLFLQFKLKLLYPIPFTTNFCYSVTSGGDIDLDIDRPTLNPLIISWENLFFLSYPSKRDQMCILALESSP